MDADGTKRIRPRTHRQSAGRDDSAGHRQWRRRIRQRLPAGGRGGADAVLAASVFHFGQITIPEVKEVLAEAGFPVRRRYTRGSRRDSARSFRGRR